MPKPSKSLPSLKFKFLEVADFEFLCFDMVRSLMSYGEPIPDYSTRDVSLLESALANPKQMFAGKLLYPSLPKQAAILFYSLIKNHPFKNGNKRIAVMGLLSHLALNKKWLEIHPNVLYKLAYDVSDSNPHKKDEILSRLSEVIDKYLVAFPKSIKLSSKGDK